MPKKDNKKKKTKNINSENSSKTVSAKNEQPVSEKIQKPENLADKVIENAPPRSEKEAKRRSSLTDSPLTSSSSSSADDTELHNSNKTSTTNDKEKLLKHEAEIAQSNLKKNTSNIKMLLNENITSLKKKKQKKNNENVSSSDVIDVRQILEEQMNVPSKSKNFTKPSYSTAGSDTTITTVSATSPKMIYNFKENGKSFSFTSSSANVKSTELVSLQGPSSSSYVENNIKKGNIPQQQQQQRNSKLSCEMSQEEKSQLIKDMDNSFEQFGLLSGRRTLSENWNTWQDFRTKPQQTFVVTTLRQEMDSSRKIIENLRKSMNSRFYGNPYIQFLHKMIFNGEAKNVIRRLEVIAIALVRKKLAEKTDQVCNLDMLIRRIIWTVMKHFESSEGTSIFTVLSSNYLFTQRCPTSDHGYCRLITTLYRHCSLQERQYLMSIVTKSSGKSAFHFAACIGENCQFKAIMLTGLNPNIWDYSGRAPLHYAIERKNIDMQKMLSWYGGNMALLPKNSLYNFKFDKTPCFLLAGSFLTTRIRAMQNTFTNYVKFFLNEHAPQLQIIEPISPIHTTRFYCIESVGKNTSTVTTSFNLKINKTGSGIKLFLFMIPTFYHKEDQYSTYTNNSQFFPVKFPPNVGISDSLILIKGDNPNNTQNVKKVNRDLFMLPPSQIVAYQLADDIDVKSPHFLVFDISSVEPFPEPKRDFAVYPILQLMAFALKVPIQPFELDKLLQIKPNEPNTIKYSKNEKAKLD